MNRKRTTQQTLQGKLCCAIYEKFGDDSLPEMARTYLEYGREVGSGLAAKWQVKNLEEAAEKFAEMVTRAGLEAELEKGEGWVSMAGAVCPFGLENTHRGVCEAVMCMDRGMFSSVLGVDPERIALKIPETLAVGDSRCRAVFSLKD